MPKTKHICCELDIDDAASRDINLCSFCEYEYKNRRRCKFCRRLYICVHSSARNKGSFCSGICEESSR